VVNRYKDGVVRATYHGPQTIESISEFLDKHTLSKPDDTEPRIGTEPGTELQVLSNEAGEVLVLDTKAFSEMLGRNALGPTFVKFYAPWCTHCKHLAPSKQNLAPE
jgi:thioredoxin domain-containing protein 5